MSKRQFYGTAHPDKEGQITAQEVKRNASFLRINKKLVDLASKTWKIYRLDHVISVKCLHKRKRTVNSLVDFNGAFSPVYNPIF